jgi:hypothetical protein
MSGIHITHVSYVVLPISWDSLKNDMFTGNVTT